MLKTKITLISLMTMILVGIINSTSAFIAYELLVPNQNSSEQGLITSDNQAVVKDLPEPEQTTTVSTGEISSSPTNINTADGQQVVFRSSSDKLVAGQEPQPASVEAKPDGTVIYKWCSGVNPDLPDDVCGAIVSIAANPVESNPHLSSKVKQSLSLLPKDTSLAMDENSWKSTGQNSGTMIVTASTSEYGDVRLLIFLEKQQDIWVLTDGQLA